MPRQLAPGRAIHEAINQGFSDVVFLESRLVEKTDTRKARWVVILKGNFRGEPHHINVSFLPGSENLYVASRPEAQRPPPRKADSVPNPRAGSPEVYDPRLEQIRAQRQGIYETTVLRILKRKTFRDRYGNRADLLLEPDEIRETGKSMFSIGTGVPSRDARLKRGTQEPTAKASLESYRRYQDPDHVLRNRQDYEETLALLRHSGFYRPTVEYTHRGVRYFVWPLQPGQRVPAGYLTQREAEDVAAHLSAKKDPRATGKWWKPPSEPYTKEELAHWLPPDSAFK